MTGSKGTWLTAMKQAIRSPSPARGFHPSSTPATPHRQSVDNFLARLGDLYETAVKSEDKSAPLDPPRRNVRRSPRRDPLKGQQAVDPKEQPAVQEFKVQETALARQKGLIRAQEEQNKHARAAAAASAAAAESAAAAAQAAAEIVRLTYAGSPKFEPPVEKSREEHAATKIQAAFRGHLARQALRALRGLVKLQAVVRGHLVRRQARIALSCMQALVRLQARVRARQVTTLENSTIVENIVNAQLDSPKIKVQQMQVRREAHVKQQRKLHEIPAQKLQDSRSSYRSEMRSNCSQLDDRSGTWDNSVFSKEELQCKILKKQNAAAVRQRTMAYAEMRQSGGRTPRRGAAAGSYAVEETRKAMVEADNEEMARYSLDEMVMEAEEAMAGGDWSWLEGWMSSQGVALWERNSFRSTSTSSAFITNNLINNNCFDDMIQNQNDHEEEPALKIIEVDRSASYPNFNKPPPPPLLLAPPPPPRRRSSITPTRAHFPSSSSSSTVSRVNNYGSRSPIPPPRRRTP